MGQYYAQVIAVRKLSNVIKEQMFTLFEGHYDGVSSLNFYGDLHKKHSVILLLWKKNLVGFTTLMQYQTNWQGKNITILFSGDTIVEKNHWGQLKLACTMLTYMGEIKRKNKENPLYWFLIVKGHRTFRYLSVFGYEFFPHWSMDKSDLKPLADLLAINMFGENYNQSSGVVEFNNSRGHLKAEILLPRKNEFEKDAVRFFLKQNPNYTKGHELVCLCELTENNLKPFARRLFMRGGV